LALKDDGGGGGWGGGVGGGGLGLRRVTGRKRIHKALEN
jgi:hypothetical protein